MNLMLLLKLSAVIIGQWIILSDASLQISLASSPNGMMIIIATEIHQPGNSSLAISQVANVLDSSADQVTPGTVNDKVSKVLQDLHKISKNISHSKGHLIKNKDGEIEFRRSMTRKIMESANSLALQKWLLVLKNNSSAQLRALNELEFLVHQYETAVAFKNLGGIDLMFSFINHENISIASGAWFVLTAAMQGNPEIQKHVEKFRVIEYLLDALSYESYSSVPGSLSALSSYLRNMPSHQMEFLNNQGLTVLGNILKHSGVKVPYQVRVIDLIGVLAKEIYTFPENGNEIRNSKLQQIFAKGVIDNGVCGKIPNYLQYMEFVLHEKIVEAMDALSMICYDDFSKEHVIRSIKNLKEYYNPNENDDEHSSMDEELKSIIYESLEVLLQKIIRIKIEL